VGGVTYRNPAQHAKITTMLDLISGGRAWHGLGAAWFEGEDRAYGFDFPPLAERFERLEEALQIARQMFVDGVATFHGRYYRADGALNNPRPLRGDIPVVIGGSGERKTLRLVAQYADGCNFFGDVERVRHLLGVLEAHCERLGRDPAEITKTRMGVVSIAPTHEPALAKTEGMRRAGIPEERVASVWEVIPTR
jgi:alkanesulfonate monooxygenase SsuD/methylene tetrahydromethanopterin reductase-like flavin-dependent oxidoreductase (luciferase family)